MRNKYSISRKMVLEFESPVSENHFFGYYTKSPLSSDNSKLLVHKVNFNSREVGIGDIAEVGYFDLDCGKWLKLGNTLAFNWQQGSMLQWIGPDYKNRVIYNDIVGGKLIARAIDISKQATLNIPFPIYSVDNIGKYALGFNFERYNFCRAYSYASIRDETYNVPIHPEDGIWKINLHTGLRRILIKTKDIAEYGGINNFDKSSYHWLEQADWNNDGSRFKFNHRYGIGDDYKTRVFTSDSNGDDLFCLEGSDEMSYTHSGWVNRDTFVVYGVKSNKIGVFYNQIASGSSLVSSLPIRLYRRIKTYIPDVITKRRLVTSGYYIVKDKGSIVKLISKGRLYEDGHPSWSNDGRFLLTDTYANQTGFRSLLLYDIKSNRVHELGTFYSPVNNSNFRCDLHPRFSIDNNYIVVDTAHNLSRQIMVFRISWNRI